MIDILLTASCYKSARSAERMINSLKYLESNIILIITAPLDEDIDYLRKLTSDNVILFKTTWNNMYSCRNWGFIWAINNGILPTYYCSCDDDIEFIEDSKEMLDRLCANEFSVMSFHNGAQNYPCYGGLDIGTCRVLRWLNGDCMFTSLDDNINYGLPDCLLDGEDVPYHIESEYQQRLCVLTGKPILADIDKMFYIHHWIDDEEKTNMRSHNSALRVKSGFQFFKAKYFRHPKEETSDDFHGRLRKHIADNPKEAYRNFLYRIVWEGMDSIKYIYKSTGGEYERVSS
jgi:hypothetical protein